MICFCSLVLPHALVWRRHPPTLQFSPEKQLIGILRKSPSSTLYAPSVQLMRKLYLCDHSHTSIQFDSQSFLDMGLFFL